MAAALVPAKEELSCPICYELLVDPHTPKNLPSCGHICCEVCLKQMVEGQWACPECRQIIRIPAGGIDSLTTNYRLRSLAENHQKDDDNLPQSYRSSKKAKASHFVDREDEKMHFFCVTCNSLACQACLVLYQNETGQNSAGDIKINYRNQKGEMGSTIIKAKSRNDEREMILNELKRGEIHNTACKNITEVCENVRKQIETCIEDHINELNTESQELIEQVEQAKQMHIAELKKLKKEPSTIQKYIDSANVAYQATMSATENLPDYEYGTQNVHLINKLEGMEISRPTTPGRRRKQDFIKFVPSSSCIKLGQISLMGMMDES